MNYDFNRIYEHWPRIENKKKGNSRIGNCIKFSINKHKKKDGTTSNDYRLLIGAELAKIFQHDRFDICQKNGSYAIFPCEDGRFRYAKDNTFVAGISSKTVEHIFETVKDRCDSGRCINAFLYDGAIIFPDLPM